jgi:hypothetical protein
VIIDAGRRYGITVDWRSDAPIDSYKLPADFSWGPQGDCGFSVSTNYVYGHSCSSAHIFHEFVHAIIGKSSVVADEGYLLMPFEWRLAHHLAKDMKEDAVWFLEDVNNYQSVTCIGDPHNDERAGELGYLGYNARASKWWRRALSRAVRVGLLTGRGMPTWKRPQWVGSGVSPYPLKWSPGFDHRYR